MSLLKISVRLSLGFAILIGILLSIGWVGLERMAAINNDLETVVNKRWPKIQSAQEALDLMNENSRITLEIFLVGGRADVDRLIAQQDQNKHKIDELMESIERGLDVDRGRTLFGSVKEARARYVESFTRARTLLLQGKQDEARASAVSEVVPNLNELRRAWGGFFAFHNDAMNRTSEEGAKNYASARSG